MNSARVRFEKQEQKTVAGRKETVWAAFYAAWADLPALSVREQTDVHNRKLTDAITLEVRICKEIREILDNLKAYQVICDGKPYKLNSADKSRKRQGWVRLLASRWD